jgi:hypothetical protein
MTAAETLIRIRKYLRALMTADGVFLAATWVGVIALAVGVICAVAVAVSGSIRDNDLKLQLAHANVRITANEHAAERAKADAELAREGAAEANERTAVAQLEQERLKAFVKWRTVDPADLKILVSELCKGSGEIDLAFVPSDPESKYFALKVIGNGGFAAANDSNGAVNWRVHLRQWHSDGMFFGLAIPGPETTQVKFLRHAFTAAHIKFSTDPLPEETSPISIGVGLTYSPAPKHDALIVVGLREPPL